MPRPTSVTVFAILNIVFGALGLMCMPVLLLMLFMPVDPRNPTSQITHESQGYRVFMFVETPVTVLAAAVLVAAGIGMLSLRPWARQAAIGYAIFGIVNALVGLVANYFLLLAPLLERARQSNSPEAMGGAIGGGIGGVCGGVLGIVYPVLLLIFMFRANVAAAFQGGGAELLPAEEFDPR